MLGVLKGSLGVDVVAAIAKRNGTFSTTCCQSTGVVN